MRRKPSLISTIEDACGWCCSSAGMPWVIAAAGLAMLSSPLLGSPGAGAVFALALATFAALALRRARREALIRELESESGAACMTDRSCAGKQCCPPARES